MNTIQNQDYIKTLEDSIWPQAVAKLHWGHTSLIFGKIKDKAERMFYLTKAKEEQFKRIFSDG